MFLSVDKETDTAPWAPNKLVIVTTKFCFIPNVLMRSKSFMLFETKRALTLLEVIRSRTKVSYSNIPGTHFTKLIYDRGWGPVKSI